MKIRDLMGAGHNVDLDDDVAGDGGIRPLAGSVFERKASAAGREPAPPAETLAEQMLSEMRMLRETNTQLAAHLRGQLVNDVLGVEIATFNAEGIITRDYRVAIGSLTVANHTANNVTVASGPAAGPAAPGTGKGLQLVRPAIQRTINLGASHSVTLYGLAGGTVSLEVFTRPQPPSSGPA